MSPVNTIGFCLAGAVLAVLAMPINAQSNAQVKVTVNWQSAKSAIRSSDSAMLMNSGAYRFVYLANDELPGAIERQAQKESYSSAESVATWRLVHLPHLDYFEIQIGW